MSRLAVVLVPALLLASPVGAMKEHAIFRQ
jgi:hypothetical protein